MNLFAAAIPAEWIFYIFEAVDIIKDALDDIDWAYVRLAVDKMAALPDWDEEAALDKAAKDIAEDLDEAIDWSEKLPGFFGELLEAKDEDLWKRVVKAEARRQANRAVRKAKRGRKVNTARYTKRLMRRLEKAHAVAPKGSKAGARRK